MSHHLRSLLATALVLVSVSSQMQSEPLVRHQTLTFSGEVLKHENLSAVVLNQGLMFAADDELRGLLVGKKISEGTFDFGPVIPLALPPGSTDAGTEFDIEAFAVSGSDVFAIGSHSAVRRSSDDPDRTQAKNRERQLTPELRPDREWLFRFQPELHPTNPELAKPVQAVSLTRLIQANEILKKFVGVPGKENGIDIEALAADGSTLVVGFRGPVLRHGFVPVMKVSGFPNVVAGELLFVQLGGRGIRDLVKVDNGFLVLAGPVGDSDQSHQVYWWDGKDCVPGKDVPRCSVALKGDVPSADNGRAEGITVLNTTPTAYELLVVFDGVKGGAPTTFHVAR